ncbi:hypothetical protein BP5796_07802 [Coleophoma crateriformis]|uniref:Glucosidase 2 subunit beta n=1 Tax=Coleophoma crateriformis TaxID=565419 RepID=A0A3D8RCW8_9HELO|nr:hypothetical protein BP5796_07802 [Coleophoma crateriformis]
MRRIDALVLLGTAATSVLASEPAGPRGVGPEFVKFYQSKDTFTCISNPSITISSSQINDDYCDCPDGSDEPGTSACTSLSHLSPPQPIVGAPNTTLALPGFYCQNKGHLPSYIPFTYVNDGVCDYERCCDGSDEWNGVGGTKCEDKCKEIGKEWRRLDDIRQKAAKKAEKKRDELLTTAAGLRKGVEDSIAKLEKEIKEKEIKADELKKKYEEVEKREKGKVVKSSGKGSKVTILAGLAKDRIEELRSAVMALIEKRDDLKKRVTELETILATFKEERNPNFNDEGVKRAVKAWEDYAAKKASEGQEDDSAQERDIEAISQPDTAENGGIVWSQYETDEDSDVDALYKFEEYLPAPVREWVHAKMQALRVVLIENGILADTSANSGSESLLVKKAREDYQEVADEISTKAHEVGEKQRDLEKDYGTADIFRALKGSCVSKDTGEYIYELCWLEKTTQKPKKGGGNTGMGNFARIDTMEVDEEVGADGKGLGKGERVVLRYENGQHCWNGPNRQTAVVLACAEKDEIWKVQELEKCSYRMDVGTPAACGPLEARKEEVKKDEL